VHLDKEGRRLGIVLADVAGHAMQAATVAMRFNEMVRYEVLGTSSPEEILRRLDTSVLGNIPPEMFVTCGIGIVDVSGMTFSFASTANPEVFHFSMGTQNVRDLGVVGYPLGIPLQLRAQESFGSTTIKLSAGDSVVLTSDGITDALNPPGEFYEEERLAAVIRDSSSTASSAEEIRDAILADIQRFVGDAPQSDDMCSRTCGSHRLVF
jgi:serine phosphatase RsbU (regulator of sigma subunit)